MDSQKTLLFVDDEQEILNILVDLFSNDGYSLRTATGAEQARDIVNQQSIDFILSDLKLPDGSGKDFLGEVKDSKPEVVRVLTSGYLDIRFGRIEEDKKDGTYYVSKPWDLTCLKQLVTETVG
ncbi:response regulator [candidate division KSB1 bacterium]|nr:response regulator [candidate division KSB1 bacterium]